ncbi:MAG TPA: sugar ABC transporter permease [Chloroflexota bacterium]|jgi:multiple sugar transport system permease protein
MENVAGFLFISPWLARFFLYEAGPVLAAMYLSLTNYDLLTGADFTGLRNYQLMFGRDPLFWHTLRITAIYSVVGVLLQTLLGIALALLLNARIRGITVYRTIFYLPSVVSGVAVSYMWLWVLNPEGGILNTLLSYVGIVGPNWLFSLEWALPTFILMSLWGLGGGMILYLAGLQGVSTELYEAAALDGAGSWSKFWHITVPMISPVIFFNVVIGMINSFQVFTGSYIMTRGGPANATLFYVLYLYRHAFENFRMGYASALAMVLFMIILSLTILSFRLSSRLVYYEGRSR